VDLYSDNGYPFAQSKLISIEKINPGGLNLNIEATAGPYIRVDSLHFESNKSVSQDFLKRVSGWQTGEPFSQNALDNSINRINSLAYMSLKKPPEEYYYNDYRSCLLTYDIRQVGSNRVEGALGYNPKSNNTEGFVFGFLNLSFYNPFGDGKNFFIKWNKPNQASSNLALNFEYPYPLGSPLETSFHLEQEKLSEFYLALRLGTEIFQELSSNYRLNAGLEWSKITARGDVFRSVYNSRIYQASLGIRLANAKAVI
jgi:outer membrane protein assembly factor BamA